MTPSDRSNPRSSGPGRPGGGLRAIPIAVAGAVLCWLGMRIAFPPSKPPAPDTTTVDAIETAPEPEAAPPVAPAAVAPTKPAPKPVLVQRPARTPADPPPQRYDPVTESPTIHSPDGVQIERTWGDRREYVNQFRLHGHEFKTESIFRYAAMAAHFYQEAPRYGFPTKIDPDGVIRIYDPGSNTYGEYNPDGTTRLFLRPKEGQAFFDQQPGIAPMSP